MNIYGTSPCIYIYCRLDVDYRRNINGVPRECRKTIKMRNVPIFQGSGTLCTLARARIASRYFNFQQLQHFKHGTMQGMLAKHSEIIHSIFGNIIFIISHSFCEILG